MKQLRTPSADLEQFVAAATAAVATVEVIDRHSIGLARRHFASGRRR